MKKFKMEYWREENAEYIVNAENEEEAQTLMLYILNDRTKRHKHFDPNIINLGVSNQVIVIERICEE